MAQPFRGRRHTRRQDDSARRTAGHHHRRPAAAIRAAIARPYRPAGASGARSAGDRIAPQRHHPLYRRQAEAGRVDGTGACRTHATLRPLDEGRAPQLPQRCEAIPSTSARSADSRLASRLLDSPRRRAGRLADRLRECRESPAGACRGTAPGDGCSAALGASRGRLVRAALSESLLLAAAGGVGGCALAVFLTALVCGHRTRWHSAASSGGTRYASPALLDRDVAGGRSAVRLGAGAFHSAWRDSRRLAHRRRAQPFLPSIAGSRTDRHLGGAAGRRGILLRSLWNLENQPLGMRTSGVLTATVALAPQAYPIRPAAPRSSMNGRKGCATYRGERCGAGQRLAAAHQCRAVDVV